MPNLRVRYKDLTQIEKEVICNGCGPKGLFIPIPQFRFRASCNHHDFQYWLGCNRKQRLKADLQFLKMMLIDANTCDDPKERKKHIVAAIIYYRAVRIGGVLCFHWARKQRNRIDLSIQIAKAMAKL